MMKVFCPSCGNEVSSEQKFCPVCGFAMSSVDDNIEHENASAQSEAEQTAFVDVTTNAEQNAVASEPVHVQHFGDKPTNENVNAAANQEAYQQAQQQNSNYFHGNINNPANYPYNLLNADKPSGMMNFFSFIFPVAGLILYLTERKYKPNFAKSAGRWAIGGAVTKVVFGVLITIIMTALAVVTPYDVFRNHFDDFSDSGAYFDFYSDDYYDSDDWMERRAFENFFDENGLTFGSLQ